MKKCLTLILLFISLSLYSQNDDSNLQLYKRNINNTCVGVSYMGIGVGMMAVGSYTLFRYDIEKPLMLMTFGGLITLTGCYFIVNEKHNFVGGSSYSFNRNGIVINF